MPPTPDNLTLDEIGQRFNTDEAAREYLEAIRWPHGVVCPHCKNADAKRIWKIQPNEKKKVRAGLYQCAECNKQFTVTVGTIFEDSHIPLRKWLVAWYLVASSKKGISSLQIQRILDLGSYRTALFMTHRIRHTLKEPSIMEKLTGTVEVDETYVGGKMKRKVGGKWLPDNKVPVVSVLQRGGKVRSQVLRKVTGKNLRAIINKNVAAGSDVNTDDHYGYRRMSARFNHYAVKHMWGQYVKRKGDKLITTNGVEGFFSLLKRGVVGTFHHVSEQHLPLYLAEFDHRHNCREMTDGERTVDGLKRIEGKRLMYRAPVG